MDFIPDLHPKWQTICNNIMCSLVAGRKQRWDHSEATDRHLNRLAAGVYCWNTAVPNGKRTEIPYQVANKGYPVILCNVNNFYLDLAYDAHPDEEAREPDMWMNLKAFHASISCIRSSVLMWLGNPDHLRIF